MTGAKDSWCTTRIDKCHRAPLAAESRTQERQVERERTESDIMTTGTRSDSQPFGFKLAHSISGSVLHVNVEWTDVPAEDVEFAFYLYRDEGVEWRGAYSQHSEASFALTSTGSYKVKGFARSPMAKWTAMTEVIQFDGTPYGSSAKPIPLDLDFAPLDYPHRDFVLFSGGALSEERLSVASERLRLTVPGLRSSVWKTEAGDVELRWTSSEPENHPNFVFSGMARTSTEFIFGEKDLDDRRVPEISESVGDFSLAVRHDWGVEIATDYFGIGQVYYYSKGGVHCISNRYHLLLLTLSSLDEPIVLDRVKARASLQAANQPFTQNFTRRMDVADCYSVPVGKKLQVTGEGLRLIDSEIAAILNLPTDELIDEVEYWDGIAIAADEIVSNLKVVLDHPSFDNVRVDLTGGLDARLLFAALSHLGSHADRIGIHTADVPGSPHDLGISLALTRETEFGYDTCAKEMFDVSATSSMAENQSYNLGTYFGIRPERVRSRLDRVLRINGFYGEITARPYFARLIYGRASENLESGEFSAAYIRSIPETHRPLEGPYELTSLFREEFEMLPGDRATAKLDAFYLFYRNSLHCSDRWLNHVLAPAWGPLQSKALFALKWRSFSRHKDIRLQVDITEYLNKGLSLIPIGRATDNADRAEIDARYQVPDGDIDKTLELTESDFERYQKAADVRQERARRAFGADRHVVLAENEIFPTRLQARLSEALHALSVRDCVLTRAEADKIRDLLQLTGDDAVMPTSHQNLVLCNKLLSLHHQWLLTAQAGRG